MRTKQIRKLVPLALVAGALVFGASAAAEVINGVIDGNDDAKTRANTVFNNDTPSTCSSAKPYPGTLATAGERYDVYTRTNTMGTSQCFTFQLDNAAGGSTDCDGLFGSPAKCAFSEVYSSFNPNIASDGYLGDIGSLVVPGGTGSYGVVIPAGGSFTVVVEEYNAGLGTNNYTLTITSSNAPTAVGLSTISASRTEKGVVVRWSVASAPATIGFDVFRLTGRSRTRVNTHAIPVRSSQLASRYSIVDRRAPRSQRLRYEIDAIALDGTRTFLGVATLSRA